MLSLEVEHARKQAGLQIGGALVPALVEYWMKAAFAPLRRRLCIFEQSRSRGGRQTGGMIDAIFTTAAEHAFEGVELELARGVVAAMADETAILHQRPNVSFVGRRAPNSPA